VLSFTAFEVYRRGAKHLSLLWPLPLPLGIGVLVGTPESSTAILPAPLSLLFLLLSLLPLSLYIHRQSLLLEELTGHSVRGSPLHIYFSLLFLGLILFFLHLVGLGPLGVIFLPLPAAVSVEGPRGIRSFLLCWRPIPLIELIFIVLSLLLTSYALEIYLPYGFLLSTALTIIFTLPYTLTYLLLLYFTRYPIARSSLFSEGF